MNKIRSGLNAGCSLLLVAGYALYLAFKPLDSAFHWLTREPAVLHIAPAALIAFEAIALAILGPLVLGAMNYVFSNGFYQTCAQILSCWSAGLKSGIVCLLLVLPCLVIRQVIQSSEEPNLFTPTSPAAWLILLAALCTVAPFWALLVIRRLPTTVLRGTLFERFSPESPTAGPILGGGQ